MRLDISVTDAERVNISQPSKKLIGKYFHLKSGNSLLAASDIAVKVAVVVIHDDIKILIAFLVCCKCTNYFHSELSLQHRNNLYLSVLIFRILEHFLYSYGLPRLSNSRFVDFAESSLPYQTEIFYIALTDVFRGAIKGLPLDFCLFQLFNALALS